MASSPSDRPQAVIYAAKSTEDSHGSISTQLEDCRALADREGWEVVGTYQDEGFSAYSGNRGPDLERARQHVTRISGFLVAQHSDRVARGAGDSPEAADHLVEVVMSLRRSGATLRTCQDDFFADSRMGIVMSALMGARNTEDSARKSAATKAGKRRAWERGEFPGAPCPDGLERIGAAGDRQIRLDPNRIEVIRLIGELADEGWGEPSIAREMNRRGHRTKGGGAWTRTRIQDLLSNAIYYGGIPWRRGTADEEINWDASFPSPWTREDFERRRRGRRDRDLAKGSDRRPGPPHRNHALAGLALCGRCIIAGRDEVMRPVTSTYRRKDGSRKRTYVCRHVHECTGVCDAPPIDAELIDTHVVNELQRYLGDFEAWREQLQTGYASERERLERELSTAVDSCSEQERICERFERAIGLAEDETQTKVAMRAAARAEEDLARERTRLEAVRRALEEVPEEAPADAMLDFYNELSAAVRGRLEGANTISRVNDALRDVFEAFILEPPPHPLGEGIFVIPILRKDGPPTAEWLDRSGDLGRCITEDEVEPIAPPLRTLHAPSGQSGNAWEAWHFGYSADPPPCSQAGNAVLAGEPLGEEEGLGRSSGLPDFVPAPYRAPLLRSASRWNVSPGLLAAQLEAESGFNPRAVSPAGALGMAQFMPATARSYGLRDPFDPVASIDAQAHLMSDLLRRFHSVPLALAAYNAGSGAVAGCGCVPSYPETRAYVARILALANGVGVLLSPPLEVRLVA